MSYIERDVALNAIQNLPSVCGCSAIDRDEAENAIMTLPAADVVEVRHGHWNRAGQDSASCSLCGKVNDNCLNNNFCPNCGAKMDGKRR